MRSKFDYEFYHQFGGIYKCITSPHRVDIGQCFTEKQLVEVINNYNTQVFHDNKPYRFIK